MSESDSSQTPLPPNLIPNVDNLPTPPAEIVVTKNYWLGRGNRDYVEVTADNTTQRLAYAGSVFERLVELCTALPNTDTTYTLSEVESALEGTWHVANTRTHCRNIAREMPDTVFRMYESFIAIGNIVLVGRRITEEEVALTQRLEYERDKANIDRDKETILDQHHAPISVDEQRHYYLPLDRGKALLAARVMIAIQQRGHQEAVDGDEIAASVWLVMPTIERELFITRRSEVTSNAPSYIKKPVLEVMRTLTRLISLTRETSGEHFLLNGNLRITLHDEAPIDASELSGFLSIFPPGTPKNMVKQAGNEPIPKLALDAAGELVENWLDSQAPLSHDQALSILDLITDPDVKRAIRHQIKEMNVERTSASVLEALRERVQRALDDGFYDAWRNRMIAGNNATGDRARQIGGELPLITNPARFMTQKWHIIRPKTRE